MAAVPSTEPTPAAVAAHDLYERYGRQIFAFCVHRLGSREEAEDAVQSTFLNAFRSLQSGVEPRAEAAWLFKIAENVCLTRLRSSSRRRRLESPTDLHALQDVVPSRSGESDELFNLPEALARMPQSQRYALLLREWHGLSYAEIATELELSQSAVETLLFRARRSLARGLEEPPAPEPQPRLRRVRAGELGSFFTVLKTLLFGGGVKVAATVATVAATSVAVTPPARHEVEHVVREGARFAAPKHAEPKPVVRKPAAAVLAPRVAAQQPVVPVVPPKVRHEPRPVAAKRPAARHPVRVVAHVTRPKPHAPALPRYAAHEPLPAVVPAAPAPELPPAVIEHDRAEAQVEKQERSPKPARVEQAAAKPKKTHATREKQAVEHEAAPRVEAPTLAEPKVRGAHKAKEPRLPKQQESVAAVTRTTPDEHSGKAHAEKTPKAAEEKSHGGKRGRDEAVVPAEAAIPPAEAPVAAAPPDDGALAPPPGEPPTTS